MDIREIHKIIKKEKDKWASEQTEDKIVKDVRKFLESAKYDAILKILGFNLNYDTSRKKHYFQVDHCNGRSGNSLIGKAIESAVLKNVEEQFKNCFKLDTNELKQVKEEVHKDYIRAYKRVASDKAIKEARTHATEFVKEQIGEALKGEAEMIRTVMLDSE